MPSRRKLVPFNKAKLARLKVAYQQALSQKQEMFRFEGEDYMTGFAKYVIEHLETELKTNPTATTRPQSH